MGELLLLLSLVATVATIAVFRFTRSRVDDAALTREWIEFLQEDLSASL